MKVGILGVGLLSAGLDGWMKGRAVLAGTTSYRPGSVPEPESPLVPANETGSERTGQPQFMKTRI